MKLVIVHYHLNRGGVAGVIRNELKLFEGLSVEERPEEVLLVYGGRKKGWPEESAARPPCLKITYLKIPSLDYDSVRDSDNLSINLSKQILSSLAELNFLPEETVIQVHNPYLGKNSLLPEAILSLAQMKYHMLLHIHDFAENYRPENWGRLKAKELYPQAANIHYSVLTTEVYEMLCLAGIEKIRLHYLPNPLFPRKKRAEGRKLTFIPQDNLFLLYPVRGIGRKNLGELLLIALCCENKVSIGITLAPINQVEQSLYGEWKFLSSELELPVHFELGEEGGPGYEECLSACDAFVTTSIEEGFGLPFLECWLIGVPLVGRNLSRVTADFVREGIHFEGLYESLNIPSQFFDVEDLTNEACKLYEKLLLSYGLSGPSDTDLLDIQRKYSGEVIDFAMLPTASQKTFVNLLSGSSEIRERVRFLNPLLGQLKDGRLPTAYIRKNSELTERAYGAEVSSRRIREIYSALLNKEIHRSVVNEENSEGSIGSLDTEFLLRKFLSTSEYSPIRMVRDR